MAVLTQAIEALETANDHRTERAAILAQLRAGELSPVALVADPPECLHSMMVFDFLKHVPGVGRARLREIVRRANRDDFNVALGLGELTARRRDWLVEVLGRRGLYLAGRPQG